MPDYINLLRQKQAEKDSALKQQEPGNTDVINTTVQDPLAPVQQPEEVQQEPTPEQQTQELFRQAKHPLIAEEQPIIPDNPYTWTPEYTQRGFIEEIGNSMARGFGKHVIGGTGDIVQLINAVVPGWEIREGNQLSRYLQELGQEYEEEYQVFMPEELKDNKFELGTFMNPDFWSKTAAEYIPQLVEMILISRGLGGVAKRTAQGTVKAAAEGMTKETLEKIGKKAVVNTSERVLGGATKSARELAGQASKDWRSLFMTSTGEATQAFATGAEMFGGGVGMNLLAGLQNAGQLMNDMKILKDEEGNYLYDENDLRDMASGTMVENLKYLPIDMLSYGMVYARSTGKFNKLLNPFNKKIDKKFFNASEQLVATSKAFTQETKPLMRFLDKMGDKLGKYAERGRKLGSAASKPLFEGFEETFQESWEDWAVKKARAKVTGEPLTIDGKEIDPRGGLDFMNFYFSKENEATRTIAMALGMLGGAGSNIVEAINKKAQQQFNNYTKTEAFKHAATNEKDYDAQTAYIRDQLVDNAIDGNVDSETWIDELVDSGVIAEDTREEWKGIAKDLTEDAKRIKSINNLNVAGQVAYLHNKLRVKVAENDYAAQLQVYQDKIKALNEEFKNNPKKLKEELKQAEEDWASAEEGYKRKIAKAEEGAMRIASGQKADVENIKHVTNRYGNKVAIALPEELYNSYYNRTDEQVYEDAMKNRVVSKEKMKTMTNSLKDFYKSAAEKLGKFADKAKKVAKEPEKATKPTEEEPTTTAEQELPTLTADMIDTPEKRAKLPFVDATYGINTEEISKLEGEELTKALDEANAKIKIYNDELTKKAQQGKGPQGRAYKEPDATQPTTAEILLKGAEQVFRETPKRPATNFDTIIEETFEKADKGNLTKADQEIAQILKDNNVDFSNEEEARKAVEKLVDRQVGRIGKIARVDGVDTNELVDYIMTIGKEGAFQPETSSQRRKRLDKAEKAKKRREAIERKRKSSPQYLNAQQIQRAKAFNNPNFKKDFNKLIKHDPEAKQELQEIYDAYLSSTIAQATLGPDVITNQIAINQHLRRLFPNTPPQVYTMNNLYEALGGESNPDAQNALGYAIGSAILIDEKVWNQADQGAEIFMHEFLHIHYELSKNEPETKAILEAARKDTKMLDRLYELYDEQVYYAMKQPGWKPGMKKEVLMKKDMTDDQRKLLAEQLNTKSKHANGRPEAYKLPFEKQDVIKDELFAKYMQGPMAEGLTKFFTPRTDFDRQTKVKRWWKWLKSKVVENETQTINVLNALNKGEAVPVENLKAHIIGNFVSKVRGKDMSLKGRMAKADEETLVISDKHDEIRKRMNKERGIQEEQGIIDTVDAPEETTIEPTDDFLSWNERDPIEGDDMFLSDEELLAEMNDGAEMDLSTFWTKRFDKENIKNNTLIGDFVTAFNKMANERRKQKFQAFKERSKEAEQAGDLDEFYYDENGKLIDATYYEGINISKLTEKLMDVAQAYDSPIEFVRILEDSKDPLLKEFMNHMNNEHSETAMTRLKTMHFLYNNSVVLPAIIDRLDKDGNYETKTPMATQDATIIQRVNERIQSADQQKLDDVNDALYIIEAAEQPDLFEKAIATVVRFYSHDSDIAEKILKDGYLIYNKKNLTLMEGISQILYENQDNSTDSDRVKVRKGDLIKALLNTGKKFASTSVVIGPTGNQATTRMFKNHSVKLLNKIITDLRNSENTPQAKAEFMNYYSNSSEPISQNFNPILEQMWSNYHKNGTLPLMALNLGSENEMLGRSKNYKDASAEQQLMNEFLQFYDSKWNGNENYFASMDILGDSSRRVMLALPRISSQNPDGSFSDTHIAKMYKIYQKLSYDKKKKLQGKPQELPANYKQFENGLKQAVIDFQKDLTDHVDAYVKINQLTDFFEKDSNGSYLPKLTQTGKNVSSEFVFNRIANTWYAHEILSPGMYLGSITKLHKGQIAPVQALDPMLKVEMIPMAQEYKQPRPVKRDGEDIIDYNNRLQEWKEYRILTNDGIQYIIEDQAEAIRDLNPDFNFGYKLYNHSIEKENPFFKNQTSQMKGYTTILSEQEVNGKQHKGQFYPGSQQHLAHMRDLVVQRYEKFKEWYAKEFPGETYDPTFRTQTSIDAPRPKYIPILTPIDADKTSIFSIDELDGLNTKYTVEALKDPKRMQEYMELLDKIYYPKSMDGKFTGLNGENFGPQQIMDKPYFQANLSIQAITSIPYAQEGKALVGALSIQDYIARQKWVNLKSKVLDKIDPNDDYSLSNLILDTANPYDSDPYTLYALDKLQQMPYSPHIANFANNQIRALLIRHGNNASVPGTYGQTISDMGYKYIVGDNIEGFIDKPNREKIFPKVTEEYINGTSALNFYGYEEIEKMINGELRKTKRTRPMEIILPKNQRKTKTEARKSFYDPEDGGVKKAYNWLTSKTKNGQYRRLTTLKRLNLVDSNNNIIAGSIEKLLNTKAHKIYKSKESTDENQIGVYIPGETVMMTRIPHNGPAFVGVAEVVGFHTTGASNIIVPAEYSKIIGADHDGDALFVYRKARREDGSFDERTGFEGEEVGYGNWNKAFDLMVEQWLSNNMRSTLETPLDFEKEMNKIIKEIEESLYPERYDKIKKVEQQYREKKITEAEKDQQIAKIRSEEDFVMPFSPKHYTQQYNNSVIAKQTVGIAFNMHRAINMISTYQTRLANGVRVNESKKEIPNLASITINGMTKNKFEDTPAPDKLGANSRIHQSTVLANVVLDSTKNGHADAMNLNKNSIASAMILVNLGFNLKDIGFLLNHPMAKEYIARRNNIGNDYIDSGGYGKLVLDYSKEYGRDLNIYDNDSNFDVDVRKFLENGQKNPYYESKGNNMQILKLMHYLSKMTDDISIISNVTNGHKTLESNPFALEKQIKDLDALLTNNKRDSYDEKTRNATLYFNDEASKLNIMMSPEINAYKRVAREYIKIQKRLNLTNNESVRDVFSLIKDNITNEQLTERQFKEYTAKLEPFIFARLLGANNLELEELNEIFSEKELPLAKKLFAYMDYLDAEVYYEDPKNVLNRDTALTQSLFFKQGVIFDTQSIKVNPQVLQKHFGEENLEEIKADFATLPLKLQRQLIIYDLIKNGWDGEESLFPIFPNDVVKFITNRAEEFQNKSGDKFPDGIVEKAYKTLQDIETINPENNNLPSIWLDGNILSDINTPGTEGHREMIKKLGQNKKVTDRIFGTIPFRVTVFAKMKDPQTGDIERTANVFQINPLGNKLKAEDRVLKGLSTADDKQIARAKEEGSWTNKIRSVMTAYANDGHKLFEPARKYVNNLAKVSSELSVKIPNVHMVMIGDTSTNPSPNDNSPLILNTIQVNSEWRQYEEEAEARKKKSSNSSIGRFFKDDYWNYTSDEFLTEEQLLYAYEYKQTLSRSQKAELWLNYIKDKEESNSEKDNWVDSQGKLLKINPRTNKPFTEQELIDGYDKWAAKDAYATANIMVPLMLELIQRESNYQTQVISKGRAIEGEKDISPIKAYFQTNNIDSTHPATQAIQREIETDFKYFQNEKRRYFERINKVTEDLYKEKLGYQPRGGNLLQKIQLAAKLLFRNRADIYNKLYGNIVKVERRKKGGEYQKRFALLSESELRSRLENGIISQAEYNFASTFREITAELDPARYAKDYIRGGIPHVGPGRLEAFGRKGWLGVLTTSRPLEEAIYDVRLDFNGETMTFKEIEDIYRQDLSNTFKNNVDYLKYRRKANKLYKQGINEDGSKFQHSRVWNHTLLGDGMVNNFANGGWISENDLLSMDLNRALADYTHTQLFVNGNENFSGFKNLQAKVDGLILHNQMKGFTNQNKFVRQVYKEYFLRGKKLNKPTSTDKVIDAMVKGNLLYIMGWKLLAVGKGLYTIGNVVVGKYNNIKNQGGKAWIRGERRYWGIDQNGSKHRKAMGVLRNLNFMTINLYDDVSLHRKSGLDTIISDIALLPMQVTENWIQGVHFLGMLTEEQWNRFDDNGEYRDGATQIMPEEIVKIENAVKTSHGKGYTPTDQRLIQRYSWGRAIMQFSRFIPTMFYDRFAKEDINIYGQKHIGSLRAVWEPVAKMIGGEMSYEEMVNYRDSLDAEKRARFDAGLKGLAMVSVAMIAGKVLDIGVANELVGDANYLVNSEKLEYKLFPSVARTVKDMLSPLSPI